MNGLTIIGRNYKNNKWKRKKFQALLIKQCRPGLNFHEQSIPLKPLV